MRTKKNNTKILLLIIFVYFILFIYTFSSKAYNNAELVNNRHESLEDYQVVELAENIQELNAGAAEVLEECDKVIVDQNLAPNLVQVEILEKIPEYNFSDEERYMLAKIAMAEAEGENIQTKTLVILTVINRVSSDKFPDNIHDVIFQDKQFSPIIDGRWDKVEPNEDCWEALKVVEESPNYSDDALYFESGEDENNWHSRNLQYLYQSQHMRFYK